MPVLRVFALITLLAPALFPITPAEERDIALWILRLGGQVMVDGVNHPISDPFDLPGRDFRITVVDMHGTVTEPKDLEPLTKLTEVRELYIPARVWSPVSDVKAPFADESFQYYAGMKKLEKFHAGLTTLAWLDIGDEGLKRMSPLTQLKHLRVALTTIKDPKCFEALVNLESLDLNDTYVLDSSLAPLANMKNLRRLTLVGTLITDNGLKYLSDLIGMEELDLYGVKVTDAGVEHLRKLTRLRRLNLLGAQITDASVEILARFQELNELNLYRSQISNAGLAKLQQLPHLKRLDLRYSGVTNSGVRALQAVLPDCQVSYVDVTPPVSGTQASAPSGRDEKAVARWVESLGGQVQIIDGQVRSISLVRVPFTDAQLKYLVTLSGLEKLNLEATDVSDMGLESLSRQTRLYDLNLSFTSVSDRGLVSLKPLTRLRRLAMVGVRAVGPGFSHLEGLTALRELDLTTTSVTDEALVHIANMTGLERLALSNSDVSDAGLEHLLKLPNLVSLDLRGV